MFPIFNVILFDESPMITWLLSPSLEYSGGLWGGWEMIGRNFSISDVADEEDDDDDSENWWNRVDDGNDDDATIPLVSLYCCILNELLLCLWNVGVILIIIMRNFVGVEQ